MANGIGRVGWRNFVSVAPTTSSIITNGLVLNLDASNPLSYSGTGTTWTDLSGNNNVTLVNGTGYSTTNGGTLVFDGINDYVAVNNGAGLNIGNTYTTSIWVKFNGFNTVLLGSTDFTDSGYPIYVGDSNNIYIAAGQTYCGMSNANLTINQWVCLTVVRNATSVTWYKNGVVLSSNTLSTNANNVVKGIGAYNGGGFCINGNISSVQIYNRVLTGSEILQNFNSTKSRFGFTSYTTRTTAFATATGITDTTILNALNTFDTGLISNGLDTDLDVLYPFVGGTATTHKYNFMDPATFALTFNGGWIHSSTGIKPNGTNAYAQTGWVPSSRYSTGLTNGAWGSYIRQSLTAWPQFVLGSYTPGSYFGLAGNSTNTQYWRVNGEANTTPTTTLNKGMFQASRALTSTNMFVSQNGQQFELSGILANGGIPGVEVYLSANNNGGATQFGSQEQSLTYLSKGKYTQSQQLTMNNLVQALQTSLSRQV